MKGNDYYAADLVFLFFALFLDRSTGFKVKCKLGTMNVQYSDIIIKILADHNDLCWLEGDLLTMPSDTKQLKRVFRAFSRCTFGLVCTAEHFIFKIK